MRKFWAGAAVAVVLSVATAGWWAIGDDATPASPVADAVAQPETAAAPASAQADATASVQIAETADQPAIGPDEHVLGNPDAPVTVIEYASLTCPHCAHFHNETLPKLKAEYIDTGKVRLVFRDFPLDRLALRASMLAECMPADRYFDMLGVLFRTQVNWVGAKDPMAALEQLARTAGMSDETFDQCMANKDLMNDILKGYQDAQSEFDVRSTPSFIVNGEKHAGALPLEDFEKILDQALSES